MDGARTGGEVLAEPADARVETRAEGGADDGARTEDDVLLGRPADVHVEIEPSGPGHRVVTTAGPAPRYSGIPRSLTCTQEKRVPSG